MNAQSYSAAYLEALTDERAMLRAMQVRGDYDAAIDAPAFLANCESTLRRFKGGPVADSLRGSRDFWRNQVKLAGGKP